MTRRATLVLLLVALAITSCRDDSTGADSICHWIEQSTSYHMRVVDYHDYGGLEYPPGSGNVYLGVKFAVEALT
jgi:hypothetical protein